MQHDVVIEQLCAAKVGDLLQILARGLSSTIVTLRVA
jgi:hypothetical protein